MEATQPNAKPFTINGTGKQVRDVLFVDDAVSAYRSAVAHIDASAGQVYNIGGGMDNSLSLRELFAILKGMVGCTMTYTQLDWRKGDQKVFVADIRHAARDLDWQPTISSESGIHRTLEWTRDAFKDA